MDTNTDQPEPGPPDPITQELDAAAEAYRAARPRLAAAIVAAAQTGMRQVDIIRRSGYSREQVRRILRDHGISPTR